MQIWRATPMGFNPWLVAVLAAMPLCVLVVGLAAAGGALGATVVWVLAASFTGCAAWAAHMAVRARSGTTAAKASMKPTEAPRLPLGKSTVASPVRRLAGDKHETQPHGNRYR